ncbi:helix-turn-helix domain-containing protein [Nocardia sp. NPDC050435]|uniref:helix-turn-helix domain-containing protein n=1 Tax=Nocardia sp. NPDC050435 TaxID=3155040 RepID=UPI0033DAF0EF
MSNNSGSATAIGRSRLPPRPKEWPPKHIPDFGLWLWRFREHRNYTQSELARRANCSSSLVRQIETTNHPPLRKTVNHLARALDLDASQTRHLIELWYPATDLTPVAHLRRRFIAAGGLNTLEYYERQGIRAMAHTYHWDVLAANNSARRLMPGLDEADGNYLLWTFSDHGRETIVGWEHEAPQLTAAALAMFARHRDSPETQRLYTKMRRIPYFSGQMTESISLAYGCQPDELIHRLDKGVDHPISMSTLTADHLGTGDVFLTCAFEHAYSGPATRSL